MDALRMRRATGLNQQQFWNRVGMTQSAGSRYERDRTIPKPVQMLLTLAYGTQAAYRRTAARLRWNIK